MSDTRVKIQKMVAEIQSERNKKKDVDKLKQQWEGKQRELCVILIWNRTVKIGAREDHNGIKVRSEGLRTTHGYVE
jgi:hypothetical protein